MPGGGFNRQEYGRGPRGALGATMILRQFLRAKIHRATVTEANIDYVGSISIDEDLIEAAGLSEYERVEVAGLTGGHRLATYVIKAPRGSGTIGMNGAAALRIHRGERIIIFAYGLLTADELGAFRPRIVFVRDGNRVERVALGEIHGTTAP